MGAATVTVKLEPWQFDVVREALAFELEHVEKLMKETDDEQIRLASGRRAMSLQAIQRLIA